MHNRGDFDLGSHAKASGENLEYFDPKAEEHFVPWVVETAAGAEPVLREASLDIEAGSYLRLCGPSGAGKSTLLHLLGGLDAPDKGSIHHEGQDITSWPRSAFRRNPAMPAPGISKARISATTASTVAEG